MSLVRRMTAFSLAIGFTVISVITLLAPVSVHAALQDTAIADFPETNGEVYATAASSDGSVYIGGRFTMVDGVSRRNVARILSDNSVDPDFNPSIYADGDNPDVVNSFALDEGNSTLYVGGGFNTANGSTTRNNLAAVHSETGSVTSFNPNVNGIVNTLELNEAADTLYAGGGFTTVNGGTSRRDVAAFVTATGTVTAFNAGISTSTCEFGAETVYDLLYDSSSNELYIAGHFYSTDEVFSRGLSVVDAETGVADEAFVPDIVYADIANDGDDADLGRCPEVKAIQKIGNTIYAGGVFDRVNGDVSRSNFAAFDTVTGTVTGLDIAFDYTVYDMSVDPIEGDLYLGGSFSMVNGSTARNEVAAIDLDTDELTSFNPNITTEPPQPSVHALAFSNRGNFYAGGTFDHVGGEPRASLAAFANPDSDNDGVTSEVEDAAPNNGDGNNDGTPDAEQANVTSFVSPETGQYVTIVTPTGTTLSTVTAAAAPTENNFTHYYDLVGFTVAGVTTGGSVDVTILQQNPDSIDAAQLTARKYFPSTSSYQTIPDATISNQTISNQPVLSLAFSLTDGGDYDLDQTADGSITDPVSLATTSQDTLAETGQNQTMILIASTLLLALSLYKARKLYT